MPAPTEAELRVDLEEMRDELRDMIGSVDFSIAGFSADEQKLHDRLVTSIADIELKLGTIANGGTSEENASNSRSSMPGGW